MKTYAFRLKPGQDLRNSIDEFISEKKIRAGVLLSCVGNLTKVVLRMSDAKKIKTFQDSSTYEIVSLVGTLELGNSHLHISVSGKEGVVYGGHLKQGTIVGTTAEIVIGELDGLSFSRELDNETGYEELVVNKE